MIIMGVDPGLASTGVGVIEGDPRGPWRLLHSAHVTTTPMASLPERLSRINQLVQKTIDQYQPGAVAIESIFFAKNVRSAVLMAHGRGVAILAASQSRATIHEYSPLEIKQSVVGKGRADKEQVRQMVAVLLNLGDKVPKIDHETDAIACALCHAFRSQSAVRVAEMQAGTAAGTPGTDDYDARKLLLAKSLTRGRRRTSARR